jgi:RNA polymerase sigma-70 factor (ECF subfamily)
MDFCFMRFSFSVKNRSLVGPRGRPLPEYFSPPVVRNPPPARSLVRMSAARVRELGTFRPQLFGFAMRRLRDRDRAEDAVQDTLLAALEGIDRFGGGSSLGTWLVGILKHKIADALRGSSKEEPLDYDELVSHDHDPQDGLARRRLLDALDAGLRQLPSCAARVFVMRQVMGMDTAEVCRELSISPSNCWVISHRARMRLRALAADAL